MNINWFEIIAQIVNFFILLFILKKLFYKPVIKAMKDREERIDNIREEATKKREEADELIQQYKQNKKELEEKKEEKMEEAIKEAEEKKENLIESYKKEAEEKRKNYISEINEEKENFLNELRNILGKSSVDIASKILDKISDSDLTDQIFDVFIKKIKSLEKEKLQEEIKSNDKKIILSSSDSLSEKQKNIFEETISEQFNDSVEILYEIDESLIKGLELQLDSLTVHTNVKNYLKEAEDNIKKILDKKTG